MTHNQHANITLLLLLSVTIGACSSSKATYCDALSMPDNAEKVVLNRILHGFLSSGPGEDSYDNDRSALFIDSNSASIKISLDFGAGIDGPDAPPIYAAEGQSWGKVLGADEKLSIYPLARILKDLSHDLSSRRMRYTSYLAAVRLTAADTIAWALIIVTRNSNGDHWNAFHRRFESISWLPAQPTTTVVESFVKSQEASESKFVLDAIDCPRAFGLDAEHCLEVTDLQICTKAFEELIGKIPPSLIATSKSLTDAP